MIKFLQDKNTLIFLSVTLSLFFLDLSIFISDFFFIEDLLNSNENLLTPELEKVYQTLEKGFK